MTNVFRIMDAETQAQAPGPAGFFEAEHGRLVGYVRRWLDGFSEEEAEDVVQDVALNVFDRADVTAPIRDLSAYVYRALKNRVIDLLRRRKATLSLDQPAGGEDSPALADLVRDETGAPEADFERKELAGRLWEALEALAPEDRAILIATELEGWTFQELAEEWDAPLGTLLARKSRALKKVRKFLEASGKTKKEGRHHAS
jgi:RNA polymerase sigma factor (sigma-70 family)